METLRTIVMIFSTLVLLAAACGLVLWHRVQKKKASADAEEAAAARTLAWDRLKRLISDALPWLITQAERVLGGGTGQIKRSMVLAEVMKLLPADLCRISPEALRDWLEKSLAELRPLWEEIPALIE